MIKCEECGREISSKTSRCPYCGCPVEIKQSEKVRVVPKKKKDELKDKSEFLNSDKEISEKTKLFGGRVKNRCSICGFGFNDNFCPRCGWKVGTEDSVENRIKHIPNFDEDLYNSIKLPPKPSLTMDIIVIISIAVAIGSLFSVLISSFLGMFTIPIISFFLYKHMSKESYEANIKIWENKKEHFDEYRLKEYFVLKPIKEKEQEINAFKKIPSQATFFKDPLKRHNSHPIPTISYVVDSKNKNIIIIYENKRYDKIPFNKIIGFQISENKGVSSSIGRALVGGLIAGETGAIIGATNKPETISLYAISIFLNTIDEPKYDIELINEPIPRNHIAYKEALEFSNYIHASIESILSNLK